MARLQMDGLILKVLLLCYTVCHNFTCKLYTMVVQSAWSSYWQSQSVYPNRQNILKPTPPPPPSTTILSDFPMSKTPPAPLAGILLGEHGPPVGDDPKLWRLQLPVFFWENSGPYWGRKGPGYPLLHAVPHQESPSSQAALPKHAHPRDWQEGWLNWQIASALS